MPKRLTAISCDGWLMLTSVKLMGFGLDDASEAHPNLGTMVQRQYEGHSRVAEPHFSLDYKSMTATSHAWKGLLIEKDPDSAPPAYH